MVGSLDLTISKLKEKYEYRPGEALRYVCADKQCLEGLEKEVANLNSGLETPAEMNARIFNSVKMFALAENEVDEDQEENYFMNAFNDSIVDYFKEEVVSQYQSVVEMDVISAMEKRLSLEIQRNIWILIASIYMQNGLSKEWKCWQNHLLNLLSVKNQGLFLHVHLVAI